MANAIDALVYATINNNITTSAQGIDDIVNYAGTRIGSTNVLPTLDNIISGTTLKRACCLGVKNINVRIPLPPEVTFDVATEKNKVLTKFNYYDKIIQVPQGLCDPAYNRTASPNDKTVMDNCDVFFDTYCINSVDEYTLSYKILIKN